MIKKLFCIVLIFYPFTLHSLEKTKEEKVAKYVLENIQNDYTSCYGFYKIASERYQKVNVEKSIIEGLNKSADITLKFAYDLGEVLNYKPKTMTEKNQKEVKKLSIIAKKDFNKLTKKYGMMCKNLVENQKQRIDYWENKGNKKVK